MLRSLVFGFLASFFISATANAQPTPIIIIDSAQLLPSAATQTTALDIWVDGNGLAPVDLAGFQLKVDLNGPNDLVRILSLAAPNSHSYVFSPTSSAPSGLVAGDGLSVELGDFLDTGVAMLEDRDGLGSLMLEVQPGATGVYQLDISLEPGDSFLAESLTEFVSFDVAAGQVAVLIPEPSGCALGLLGIMGVICLRRQA